MARNYPAHQDSGENNKGHPPDAPFQLLDYSEKVELLKKNGFMSGVRVDANDGPRTSPRVVARYKVRDQHHSPSWIKQQDNIISETVTMQTRRELAYVHQGWSVAAIETLTPWISARIARSGQVDETGSWATKRTVVQRMVLDIPPTDLVPVPEFGVDIRTALQKPTAFEKFTALNETFEIWGDVLPVISELGALLAISDTNSNLARLTTADINLKLKDMSAHQSVRIDIRGGDTNLTTDGITSWLSGRALPSQWVIARVIRVIPVTDLLPGSLNEEIRALYTTLVSYRPRVLAGGGSQPKTFDGTLNATGKIKNIVLHGATFIDSIAMEYSNGANTARQGGPGGHKQVFSLSPDEFIVEVLVWENHQATCGIQFMTSTGRISPHYGGDRGTPSILSSEDGVLVAFSGKLTMDSYCKYDVIYRLQTIWRHDIARTIPTRRHCCSTYLGGNGGAPFNDWPYLHSLDMAHVSGIRVKHASLIDGIQFVYSSIHNGKTSTVEGAWHGGGGGRLGSFWLNPGEHIVKVQGKRGSIIDQLCFITNRGRSSGIYGGNGGHAFECQAPTGPNGVPMGLCFVVGKSAGLLDGILFIWAPVI